MNLKQIQNPDHVLSLNASSWVVPVNANQIFFFYTVGFVWDPHLYIGPGLLYRQ